MTTPHDPRPPDATSPRRLTGPRTPKGKARVALNALRHGLYARAVVLPGDDPAEFEAFARDIIETLDPVGEFETFAAERIAVNQWRLRRALDLEATVLSSPLPEKPRSLPDPAGSPPAIPAPCDPGHAYISRLDLGRDPLAGLSRYENRLHRQITRDFALYQTARTLRLQRQDESRDSAPVGRSEFRYDRWGQCISPYSTISKHAELLRLEEELGILDPWDAPDGPPDHP